MCNTILQRKGKRAPGVRGHEKGIRGGGLG